VQSRGMREQGRCVEVVEYRYIYLAGAAAGGVDYECGRGAVSLGQVAIEKLEPVMFGGCSGSRSVLKESADGKLCEHFLLHTAKDFGEVDLAGVGSAGHDGSRVAEETSCGGILNGKWLTGTGLHLAGRKEPGSGIYRY